MPLRTRSRLALLLLLFWQLGSVVAIAAPQATMPMQGLACPSHAAPGHAPAGPPGTPAPDCCQQAAAACHCVQAAVLAVGSMRFQPAVAASAALPEVAAPRVDRRDADFFRPPI